MGKVVVRASYNGENPSEETLEVVKDHIMEAVARDMALSDEEFAESLKRPAKWPFDPIKKD